MGLWARRAPADAAPSGVGAPLPQPGDVVQLQVLNDDAAIFSARVRVVGFRRLFLDSLRPIALPTRAPLTVTFIADDAMYRFETRIVGSVRGSSLSVMRPRRIQRVQRRQYYRLPFESPTTFRVLTADGRRENSGPVAARLVNLSGGGVLLSSSRPLPAGLALAVRVPSGTAGDLIDVEGEVLDCHVASHGSARAYLTRVRFFDAPRMDPEDREAIIAHIFQQQRIMLKGRKLLRA